MLERVQYSKKLGKGCALPDHVMLDNRRWSCPICFWFPAFCEKVERRARACFKDLSHWTFGTTKIFKFIFLCHHRRARNWYEAYNWDNTQIYYRLVCLLVTSRDYIFQVDNCARENENKIVFAYIEALVGGKCFVLLRCHSWQLGTLMKMLMKHSAALLKD